MLLGTGCAPDEAAYVEAARSFMAEGCCSRNYTKPVEEQCDRCALLVGARVTKATMYEGCANSCQMVTLETDGPNGKGMCTVEVLKERPLRIGGGGCHPR